MSESIKDNKIIVFKSYVNVIEAEIDKSKLEDAGIDCFLLNENTSNIIPFYNFAIGGIKLNIYEKDINAVKELIQSNNKNILDEVINDNTKCPKCNSSDVIFENPKKLKSKLFTILLSLLFFYPLYPNKLYHCNNCGNEFKEN